MLQAKDKQQNNGERGAGGLSGGGDLERPPGQVTKGQRLKG